MMEEFRFANPEFAYLFLGLPLLLFFIRFSDWRARRKVTELAHERNLKILIKEAPGVRPKTQDLLFISALGLVILALMRPQGNPDGQAIKQTSRDIIFLLDISQSMGAQDVAPDRIGWAKNFIKQSLLNFKNDQLGLVAARGGAYLATPLTRDHQALDTALKFMQPRPVGLQGTNLAQGIDVAVKAFQDGARSALDKDNPACFLIVLSDGEETMGQALKAAKSARERGVVIFAIGIGTEAGAPIPILEISGTRSTKKDPQGQEVISRLAPGFLQSIADAADGAYYEFSSSAAMSSIEKEMGRWIQKRDRIVENKRYTEYFDLPTEGAILLLLLYIYLPLLRRPKKVAQTAALLALLLPFGAEAKSLPWQSLFWTDDRIATEKAAILLKEGNAAQALELIEREMKKNQNQVLRFNSGLLLIAGGKLVEAKERLVELSDPELAPFALFTRSGIEKNLNSLTKSKELIVDTVIHLQKLTTRTPSQELLLKQAQKNLELLFKREDQTAPPPPPVTEPPQPQEALQEPTAEILDQPLSKPESEELLEKIESPDALSLEYIRSIQQSNQSDQENNWKDW